MTQQGQWQLSGSAAELYERYVVPYYFAGWSEDLIEQTDLQPGERVLDVACGTGIVARIAAERVGESGKVTGLDLNSGMLETAASVSLPSGTPPISWVQCSATDMQLEDESFDVIFCQQGFQFFPDKEGALREMSRVLVPGGRFAISVWRGSNPYLTALQNGVERHVSTEAANQMRSSRLAPGAEEFGSLITEAGFRSVQVVPSIKTRKLPPPEEYVPLHLSAMPVAADIAALDDHSRSALIKDITAELQPYVKDGELVFTDQTNIATGIK